MNFNTSIARKQDIVVFNPFFNEKEISIVPHLYIQDYPFFCFPRPYRPTPTRHRIQVGSYLVSYYPKKEKVYSVEKTSEEFKKQVNLHKLLFATIESDKGKPIPSPYPEIKNRIDPVLASLPFIRCTVNYNFFDECWNYDFYFDNDVRLNLGVFDDYEDEGIDFIVYHENKIIVANRLPLLQIIERTKKAIANIENDLANL